MDITIEQLSFGLFLISEIMGLIPERYVQSNGFLHTVIVIINKVRPTMGDLVRPKMGCGADPKMGCGADNRVAQK